jgi:hypothetical protein
MHLSDGKGVNGRQLSPAHETRFELVCQKASPNGHVAQMQVVGMLKIAVLHCLQTLNLLMEHRTVSKFKGHAGGLAFSEYITHQLKVVLLTYEFSTNQLTSDGYSDRYSDPA